MITPHNERRDRAGFAVRENLRLARTHYDRGPGRNWEQKAAGGWGPISEAAKQTGVPLTAITNWAARGKLGEVRYADGRRKVCFQQCADLWAKSAAKRAAKNVAGPTGPQMPGAGYFNGARWVHVDPADPQHLLAYAQYLRDGDKTMQCQREGDPIPQVGQTRATTPRRLLVWTPEQRRIMTTKFDPTTATTDAQRDAQLEAMVEQHNLRNDLNAETARLEAKERMRPGAGVDRSAAEARAATAAGRASEQVGPAFMSETRPLTADELADIECEYAIHDREHPDRVVVRRVGRGRERITKAAKEKAAELLKSDDDVKPAVLGTVEYDEQTDDTTGTIEYAEQVATEAEDEGYGGLGGYDRTETVGRPEPNVTVKAEPTHRATERCSGPLHRGECSWACRRSVKKKCTCACGGSNHGTAEPELRRRKPRGTTDLTGGRPQKLPTMPKRRAKRNTTQGRAG
jgi:hypothetical protein